MKLGVSYRSGERKSEAKRLRREKKIPAIIYSNGKAGEMIAVDAIEFQKILNKIKKGHLSTTKIALVDEKGKERSVIVKEIQYHVTTYNIIHLDLEELHDDVKVNVNVPIECTRVADCVGVKLGGVLRPVIRHLRVNCLPKDIPESFKMDVAEMGVNDVKRLSDFNIPSTVRPMMKLNQVAIAVVKR